eukprot:6480167-Amphidinium_carterae.1
MPSSFCISTVPSLLTRTLGDVSIDVFGVGPEVADEDPDEAAGAEEVGGKEVGINKPGVTVDSDANLALEGGVVEEGGKGVEGVSSNVTLRFPPISALLVSAITTRSLKSSSCRMASVMRALHSAL